MKILLDPGHGDDATANKSPDSRLFEYKYVRVLAQELSRSLTLAGVDSQLLVADNTNVGLNERVRRVNAWARKLGTNNVAVVSLHLNAAPGGDWNDRASGFEVYVANKSSDESKRLAKCMWEQAKKRKLGGNRALPANGYWTGNFAIVRDTLCPAVLTESLFMTNPAEVDYLLSEEGRHNIVELHKDAIQKWIAGRR